MYGRRVCSRRFRGFEHSTCALSKKIYIIGHITSDIYLKLICTVDRLTSSHLEEISRPRALHISKKVGYEPRQDIAVHAE
jgi:hypothetical protein